MYSAAVEGARADETNNLPIIATLLWPALVLLYMYMALEKFIAYLSVILQSADSMNNWRPHICEYVNRVVLL